MSNLVLQRPQECEKLDALKTEIDQVCSVAIIQKIGSKETKDGALAIGAQVKRMRAALANRRKEITAPLQDKVKQIIAFADQLDAPLAEAESHIRTQAVTYARAIEEEQRKEQARIQMERIRLQKEEDAKKRAACVVADTFEEQLGEHKKIDQEMIEKKSDLAQQSRELKSEAVKGTTQVWTFEITDENVIPRIYMVVDQSKIRNAVQRQGIRDIPGVRIFSETKVSLRSY